MQIRDLFLEKWMLKFSSWSQLGEATTLKIAPSFLSICLCVRACVLFVYSTQQIPWSTLYKVSFYFTFKTVAIHRWYCSVTLIGPFWLVGKAHFFFWQLARIFFFPVYAKFLSCSCKYIQHHSSSTWQTEKALADSNLMKKLCLFL